MATTYYKVYEFTKLFLQRDNAGTIQEVQFPWPNALKPSSEQQTYEWSGGGVKKKSSILIAQNWTLDLDAIPNAQHAQLFGKSAITAITGMTTFDLTTLVGYGGGSDAQGISVGMRATANAYAGDTEIPVEVNIWAPVCTVTLAAASGLSSGNVADKMQYNISATRTAKTITGVTIAGASADGEFFYIGESA